MEQIDNIRVRNNNESGYYQIDTTFIKGGWAKALGPYGLAVYNVLACCADNNSQIAYPSHQTIADLVGCSRRQVITIINKLIRYNLIKKYQRRHEDHQDSNFYQLVHRDNWLRPDKVGEPPTPTMPTTPESVPPAPSQSASPAPKLAPVTLTNPTLNQCAAAASPPSSGTNPANQKTSRTKSPAVERYRAVTGRYPPRATEPLIINANIVTAVDLQFWEEVIRHYIGCGWNPQNIAGMLDFYQRRQLPTTRPNRQLTQVKTNYETPQKHHGQNGYTFATPQEFGLEPA